MLKWRWSEKCYLFCSSCRKNKSNCFSRTFHTLRVLVIASIPCFSFLGSKDECSTTNVQRNWIKRKNTFNRWHFCSCERRINKRCIAQKWNVQTKCPNLFATMFYCRHLNVFVSECFHLILKWVLLLDYCIVYRRSLSDNQVNESAMPHKQLTENNNPLPWLPLAT